jgi:glutamate synthase (NADPH/NADH) small chain
VDENGMTTRLGVFAGGDVTLGPWNVVQAAKAAKEVAKQMDAYLQSLSS